MGSITLAMAALLTRLVAQEAAPSYPPTESDKLPALGEFLQQSPGLGWGIAALGLLTLATMALAKGSDNIGKLIQFLGRPSGAQQARGAPRNTTAQTRSRIFISYRRSDSIREAGRIYDYLENRFGRNAIFKDVDTIEAGDDFRDRLQEAVGQCQILLAVIGEHWLEDKDEAGRRRLENPADWVRLEIETALKRNIRVIPVLLDSVPMPSPTDLPVALQALAYRNAAPVRHDPDFRRDMARLLGVIERHFDSLGHR